MEKFDIKKSVLPLRPEERDTPNHSIYNEPTYRTKALNEQKGSTWENIQS